MGGYMRWTRFRQRNGINFLPPVGQPCAFYVETPQDPLQRGLVNGDLNRLVAGYLRQDNRMENDRAILKTRYPKQPITWTDPLAEVAQEAGVSEDVALRVLEAFFNNG